MGGGEGGGGVALHVTKFRMKQVKSHKSLIWTNKHLTLDS